MTVIKFWLNNWSCGETYPNEEPFKTWFKDDVNIPFADSKWVKENRLCVKCGAADMSIVFDITAPKEWVDKNCPNLYMYPRFFDRMEWLEDSIDAETYNDPFGYKFLDYCKGNIGITHVDEDDNMIVKE